MKQFLIKMFTARSGVSSKRILGTLGWIAGVFICIWCSIKNIDSPRIVDTLFICSTSLLGVDSIVKIARGYYPSEQEMTNNDDNEFDA